MGGPTPDDQRRTDDNMHDDVDSITNGLRGDVRSFYDLIGESTASTASQTTQRRRPQLLRSPRRHTRRKQSYKLKNSAQDSYKLKQSYKLRAELRQSYKL